MSDLPKVTTYHDRRLEDLDRATLIKALSESVETNILLLKEVQRLQKLAIWAPPGISDVGPAGNA